VAPRIFTWQGTPINANVLISYLKTMYIRLKTVVIKGKVHNKIFYVAHFVLF